MLRWLLLLLLTCAAGADPLDEYIEQNRMKYKVPGCAVAIVHQGKVVKLQGYGVRKEGESAPVDPDSIFHLASVSKALTTTMLATLADEGKLDWDKPAVNYLSELQLEHPFPTENVTTRDFLSHRSGLPKFGGNTLGELGVSRAEIVRRVRYLPLSEGFREKAGYSNVGIFLAGEVGARVGGDTFENLMRSRVFGPLQMTRSGFLYGPHSSKDNIVAAHFAGGRAVESFEDSSKFAAAGGITSTARDLSQWVLMLLSGGGKVLKPGTVAEMFRPVMVEEPGIAETPPIDENSGFAYGLVWGLLNYNGYKVAEKGGALAGTRTIVVLVPEKQLGVVVLCNMNGTLLPELIRARVLQDYLGAGRHDFDKEIWQTQLKVNEFFAQTTGRPSRNPAAKTTLPLASYAGVYTQSLYGPLRIAEKAGELTWSFSRESSGPLIPLGYNSFYLSYPAATNKVPEMVHFLVGEKGQVLELVTESYGRFERK